MTKMAITLETLKQLKELSEKNGTQAAFLSVVMEWAENAHTEIQRLKAELGDLPQAQSFLLTELRKSRELLIRAQEALDMATAAWGQSFFPSTLVGKVTADITNHLTANKDDTSQQESILDACGRIEKGEITNAHFSHRNIVVCSKEHYHALGDAAEKNTTMCPPCNDDCDQGRTCPARIQDTGEKKCSG